MVTLIVTVVASILIVVGLVVLLQKMASPKLVPIISIILLALAAFLAYQVYNSIMGPVEFNKEKVERYRKVISNLKDIRAAQSAHQEITGSFTGSFDSLVQFIDTAKFAITQRRDTSYADVEKNKAYGLTEGYYIEETLIDTLGFSSVKDSLFDDGRHTTMMNVPGTEATFEMKAGKLDKSGALYSVFEAKVAKDIVLAGMNKDLIAQEKLTQSVDGVNGEYIKVGAMDEVDTSGNWPKLFDTEDNKKQ